MLFDMFLLYFGTYVRIWVLSINLASLVLKSGSYVHTLPRFARLYLFQNLMFVRSFVSLFVYSLAAFIIRLASLRSSSPGGVQNILAYVCDHIAIINLIDMINSMYVRS